MGANVTSALTVRSVVGWRERRVFLRFPWRIYRDDPLWVPPVLSERAARLDPARGPFFRHGEADLFVAWRGSEPLGTIAPAIDHQVVDHTGRQVAVFGFFECVAEYRVAQALLDRAVAWARERGAQVLRGPQSFGPSDEPGLLIEGRETSPGLLMGWSPPYYVTFVERYGFRKYHDALAYRAYVADYTDTSGTVHIPEKLRRVADFARQRYGYRVRQGRMEEWERELDRALEIYNRSLATLPDFAPMDRADWQHQAASLRPLLDPEMVVFAEADGREVGFGLALPDISQALLHCNGLRYPWDYARLWYHSRHLPGVSFKIMAMLDQEIMV